jgi:ACS family hexuronate transporter-like MFS transporter
MLSTHSSTSAAKTAHPHAGIGEKIRGAMAVGKTRWGMLALVFFATTLNYIERLASCSPFLPKK